MALRGCVDLRTLHTCAVIVYELEFKFSRSWTKHGLWVFCAWLVLQS